MTHLSDKATDREVLEAAIEKARENGWTGGKYLNWSGDWLGQPPKLEVINPFPSIVWLKYTTGGVNVEEHIYPPDVMLFDHEFCKSVWGDKETLETVGHQAGNTVFATITIPKFKWHLGQMAITEDRIDYLRKNMP